MTLKHWASACLVIGICVAMVTGAVTAAEPPLEVTHEHNAHEGQIVDVEYDEQTGVVFSLDQNGTFVAYLPDEETVEFAHPFETGHALAVGDMAVYIAAGNTLWEYDVAAGNISELTTMDSHVSDLAYDAERDVVWGAGGDGTVYGYAAADGSKFMQYTEHSDGLSSIDVRDDYVVSGTTWDSEVIVYNVEQETVSYEPELPDDVGQIGALELTETGDLLVGTGADEGDVIAAFDLENKEPILGYRAHLFSVSHVAWHESSQKIVSTGFDNTVKFYDPTSQSVVEEYEHDDTIYAADLDRTNQILWFGDGEEQPGTVVGLDVSGVEPPATTTQTATPTETATATQTATETTVVEETATETPTSTETESTETPGFHILAAVAGVVVAMIIRIFKRQ